MARGDYDTELVTNMIDTLIAPAATDEDLDRVLVAAAASVFLVDVQRAAQDASQAGGDAWSPWAETDAWRLYEPAGYEFAVTQADRTLAAQILRPTESGFSLSFGGVVTSVEAQKMDDRLLLLVDGVKREVAAVALDDGLVVILRGRNYVLKRPQAATSAQSQGPSDDRVMAPMPATVTRVAVKPGDAVSKGQTLVVLEAMKMEIAMAAPHDGAVKSVACAVGDMAKEGAELVTLMRKEGA